MRSTTRNSWGQPGSSGPGEFHLPHQAAVDASDNIFVVDRENRRIQVFDENLTYLREFSNDGWNPWDIAISRRGDDGFGYIADHAGERVHKISLEDGTILATWGRPGRGRRRRLRRRPAPSPKSKPIQSCSPLPRRPGRPRCNGSPRPRASER